MRDSFNIQSFFLKVGAVNAVAVPVPRQLGNFDHHLAQLRQLDEQRAANVVPAAVQNQPGRSKKVLVVSNVHYHDTYRPLQHAGIMA